MATSLLKKKPFVFLKKESLKADFWNLPFILGNKFSSYAAKRLTCFTDGRSSFPLVINFYLTELCNLNCEMCFLKQVKTENNFIPFDIVKKVIKELTCIRPRYSMTGGEPFLHPDIENLIRYIKSKGFYLSIVTNGTLIKDFAKIIVRSGVDKLAISIVGSPKKHDSIRGIPGAFFKTLEGIQSINYEKKKQKKNKPRLSLFSLLSKDNDEEFIISFAEEHLFEEINFLHFLSVTQKELEKSSKECGIKPHYWKGAVMDIKSFKIKDSLIKKIKSHAYYADFKINIRFTPDISETDLNRYYNKDRNFLDEFNGRCIAPWVAATIKPPAKVEICPDIPVGDLTKSSFLNIWNEEKVKQIRKQIYKGKMFPICSGCCNYYVSKRIRQ
jgi:MoaA/NifB/PqqE/SkfB family radical SAM enzyme